VDKKMQEIPIRRIHFKKDDKMFFVCPIIRDYRYPSLFSFVAGLEKRGCHYPTDTS